MLRGGGTFGHQFNGLCDATNKAVIRVLRSAPEIATNYGSNAKNKLRTFRPVTIESSFGSKADHSIFTVSSLLW